MTCYDSPNRRKPGNDNSQNMMLKLYNNNNNNNNNNKNSNNNNNNINRHKLICKQEPNLTKKELPDPGEGSEQQ